MSDYPWISIETCERRSDLGWTRAECNLCDSTSFDNAEPYTEDWTHEHARKCHPRWRVRKGTCPTCVNEVEREILGDVERYRNRWVIWDSVGNDFSCAETFGDAIHYADHKAREFLRGELIAAGWRP